MDAVLMETPATNSQGSPVFFYRSDFQAFSVEPNRSVVYLLVENETVVYVGRSENLRKRMMDHSKGQTWDYVLWFYCPRDISPAVERELLKVIRPKRNSVDFNRGRSGAITDAESRLLAKDPRIAKELPFSRRLVSILIHNGIQSRADLSLKTADDVVGFVGVGTTGLHELAGFLKDW